jgi:hypothetical protein
VWPAKNWVFVSEKGRQFGTMIFFRVIAAMFGPKAQPFS